MHPSRFKVPTALRLAFALYKPGAPDANWRRCADLNRVFVSYRRDRLPTEVSNSPLSPKNCPVTYPANEAKAKP